MAARTANGPDQANGPGAHRATTTGPTRRRLAWLATRGIVGLLLVLLGIAAGIAATAAWPTTVTTRQYSATIRLSPDPADRSTIHSPTVFGDLDVTFHSRVPAPGIDAGLQVRESIASVLASSGLDIRRLEPSQDELDAAARHAALAVGAKALLGIAVVMFLAWFVLSARSPVGGRWLAPAAGVLSLTLVAGSMALTYQRSAFESVRTTGLLSVVRASSGLLDDVEKRSQEATPYVRNMLALSAALQEKYAPQTVSESGSLKIVAVSDIHGANQYPLLRTLVRQEGAAAVIDAGDLLNFGTVREAEAAGLFKGIESLGVPYLFVRGNHDASSPTDDALVQRLLTIPNVVVLDPEPQRRYTVATIGGVTIGGFGDPRWFGDGGKDTDEAQRPAAAAFRRAMTSLREGTARTTFTGDRAGPLDIVVGHEPSAVEDVAAFGRVQLNGHMHRQNLFGSRIQLGSFGGGGVVSHYIEGRDGSELAGQPYAFDVLAYGSSCRLASLTRYRFTDLVEGRPTYDAVQVLNGAPISGPVPAGRTCSNLEGVRTATVEPPPADAPSAPATGSVSTSLPSGSPLPTSTETRTTAPGSTGRTSGTGHD